ncbi:hypothetical protein HZS_6659 [Henneguya salminicola]|nr:hypothetical protein HZS_6659 [Henneguya salminicola]
MVTELPGIGEVYGKRLIENGFDKAYTVLGQFLVLKKDEELFIEWLTDIIKPHNSKSCKDCYNGLKEWCESFI